MITAYQQQLLKRAHGKVDESIYNVNVYSAKLMEILLSAIEERDKLLCEMECMLNRSLGESWQLTRTHLHKVLEETP